MAKKLFIITNTPFSVVNTGMSHMVGPDWKSLFDVIICEARKPYFFQHLTKAFRRFDDGTKALSWDRVHRFKKGQVYVEGNIQQFLKMTNWAGYRTLYTGDHVFRHGLDPTAKYGWHTAAILPELEREVGNQATVQYWRGVTWLTTLENLLEDLQESEETVERAKLLREWSDERDALRYGLKALFNPQFGSLFRTHHNPTFFSRRLARFADVYTSKITNFSDYSLNHSFFPNRSALPHEWQVSPLKHNEHLFSKVTPSQVMSFADFAKNKNKSYDEVRQRRLAHLDQLEKPQV